MNAAHKRQRNGASGRALRRGAEGFTMLELMIVITIILILIGMGVGRYQQSILRAKESALKQDLQVMRQAIEQHTLDKQAAPQSLDDVVSAGYLREVPVDPITRQKDWRTDTCDLLMSPDQSVVGICEVHSNATGVSPFEGTAYSTW